MKTALAILGISVLLAVVCCAVIVLFAKWCTDDDSDGDERTHWPEHHEL